MKEGFKKIEKGGEWNHFHWFLNSSPHHFSRQCAGFIRNPFAVHDQLIYLHATGGRRWGVCSARAENKKLWKPWEIHRGWIIRSHGGSPLLLSSNWRVRLAIRKHRTHAAGGKRLHEYYRRATWRFFCVLRTNGYVFGSMILNNQYYRPQSSPLRGLITLRSPAPLTFSWKTFP